jgi:hypothetical protein
MNKVKNALELALGVFREPYCDASLDDVIKACEEALASLTCEMGEMCLQCPDAQPKQFDQCSGTKENGSCDCYVKGFNDGMKEIDQGEPVAWALFKRGRLESFWMDKGDAYDYEFTSEHEWKPLYTTPQQRKPLRDEMAKQMKERCDSMEMRGAFADGWLSAEAAHGIKE